MMLLASSQSGIGELGKLLANELDGSGIEAIDRNVQRRPPGEKRACAADEMTVTVDQQVHPRRGEAKLEGSGLSRHRHSSPVSR